MSKTENGTEIFGFITYQKTLKTFLTTKIIHGVNIAFPLALIISIYPPFFSKASNMLTAHTMLQGTR